MKEFKILPILFLSDFKKEFGGLSVKFETLKDSEVSTENFSFYTSVASVFSSKIEGENIEMDSYIKHKNYGVEFQPNYTKKIDDLYEAYLFAKDNTLNKENILKSHKILSKNILNKNQQGVFRTNNMFVITEDGKIEYVAAEPAIVENEMAKWFQDLELLQTLDLSTEEAFYFASALHLLFIKIHPMNDGNGRTARLIEKWFLAEKLGEKAWFLESEKNYYQNHQSYYANIRMLGLEYETLNYEKALNFFKMLPESLTLNQTSES